MGGVLGDFSDLDGLVVPVIRDADRKGIATLAEEMAELSKLARAGKLSEILKPLFVTFPPLSINPHLLVFPSRRAVSGRFQPVAATSSIHHTYEAWVKSDARESVAMRNDISIGMQFHR
jgi:hypothetical protein